MLVRSLHGRRHLLLLLCSELVIDDAQDLRVHLLELRLGLALAAGLGELQDLHGVGFFEGGVGTQGVQAKDHLDICATHHQLLLLHHLLRRLLRRRLPGLDGRRLGRRLLCPPLGFSLLLFLKGLGISVGIAGVVRLVHQRDRQERPQPSHVEVVDVRHIRNALHAHGVVGAPRLLRLTALFGLHRDWLHAGGLPEAHLLEALRRRVLGQGAPGDAFALCEDLLCHPIGALRRILVTDVLARDLSALLALLQHAQVHGGRPGGGLSAGHQLLPQLVLEGGVLTVELLQQRGVHRLQLLNLCFLLLPLLLCLGGLLPGLDPQLRKLLLHLRLGRLGLFLLRVVYKPLGQEVDPVLGLHHGHLGQGFGQHAAHIFLEILGCSGIHTCSG
mmetsp:Transcript_51185/g.122607  ORF Transcript_51185/g.122607 Transcript_51185/m.122607 type:complete len:387 (+) Transcript_51185:721-1881(+)